MGIVSGIASLAVLMIVVIIGYSFFTDELSGFFDNLSEQKAESEGINIQTAGNQPMRGELVCDLEIRIPVELDSSPRGLTTFAKIIENPITLGAGLVTGLAEFIDQQLYAFANNPTSGFASWQWRNCYTEGELSAASFLSLFNMQIFTERLSQLGLIDEGTPPTQFTPEMLTLFDRSEIDDLQLALFEEKTNGAKMVTFVEGFSLTNQNKLLLDKNDNFVFQRTLRFADGLQYPVADTAVFSIEDVKVDDYEIEFSVKAQPLNGKPLGIPTTFSLCGLIEASDGSLSGKMSC